MEPEKKSYGALIGSVVIIVLLVLGALYFWTTKTQAPTNTDDMEYANDQTTQELNQLELDLNAADTDLQVDAVDTLE